MKKTLNMWFAVIRFVSLYYLMGAGLGAVIRPFIPIPWLKYTVLIIGGFALGITFYRYVHTQSKILQKIVPCDL